MKGQRLKARKLEAKRKKVLRTITRMQNPVMEYAWGSRSAIPELLGMQNPEQKPMAEMWMGAHPKASSVVHVEGEWMSLEQVIRSSPETILGEGVAHRFHNQLPFLFKVLAAEKPLSIQVHPDREQAEEGFRKENGMGLPLDSPDRNYRDPNHKPEIICALGYFDALKGFRKIDEIIHLLEKVSSWPLDGLVDTLARQPGETGLKRFFAELMTMKKERMAEITGIVSKRASELREYDPAFKWVAILEKLHRGDAGVLAPLFLNLVRLHPGEALFLPAGELHAYLKGMGIELMANSDNVIRAGLTKKHVDVPELLKIARFSAGNPHVLRPSRDQAGGEEIYATPAEEFVLTRIAVQKGKTYEANSRDSVEMILCSEGTGVIEISPGDQQVPYAKGISFLIPATVQGYRVSGCGTLFSASVPSPVTTRK